MCSVLHHTHTVFTTPGEAPEAGRRILKIEIMPFMYLGNVSVIPVRPLSSFERIQAPHIQRA